MVELIHLDLLLLGLNSVVLEHGTEHGGPRDQDLLRKGTGSFGT